ncbi:MAG: glycosyltransferase [Chloroflexi bacterium]|nr:glycosyltransferase [Chloroflexota bacterium]
MSELQGEIVTERHSAYKDRQATAESRYDVCIFLHHGMVNDGRTLREASSLAAQGWRVVVIAMVLGGFDLPAREVINGFTLIRITPQALRKTLPGSWGKLLRLVLAIPAIIRAFRQAKARVYHINDFPGLVIMALSGIRRPVVYEARELFFDRWPRGVNYSLKHLIRFFRPLEKVLARRTAAVVTVNDLIADILAAKFGIPRPVVVRSAVDLRQVEPPAADFPAGRRLLAHTGNLDDGRHLAELVASLAHLPPDVGLVLMGDGPLRGQLVAQAESLGVAERLFIIRPVPPNTIASTLGQADVAAVLTSPHITNNYYALPNKFFEAVAAGLPIVTSPIPAVTALVKQYELGVTCDPTNLASIAEAVLTVLQPEHYDRYRANAQKAREALNWVAEEQKLVALYERILGTSAVGTRRAVSLPDNGTQP